MGSEMCSINVKAELSLHVLLEMQHNMIDLNNKKEQKAVAYCSTYIFCIFIWRLRECPVTGDLHLKAPEKTLVPSTAYLKNLPLPLRPGKLNVVPPPHSGLARNT